MGQQIAAEVSQVVTAHHYIVDDRERLGRLVLGDAFDDADQNVGAGHAQGQLDVVFLDLRAGITDYLIESRLRVAHRAFARARNLAQRVVGNGNLFRLGNQAQPFENFGGGDRAKLKLLAARKDCLRHFVAFGGGHDEDHARRRLFNRLQQRVEGVVDKHVHFVDDEDLVAVARRSKANRADDRFANVVNAGVRRGVDLLHVNRTAFRNFAARRAGIGVVRAAGRGGRLFRFVAIERFGEQTRGRSFPDAARAGKQIGVMQPLVLDGIAQRARDGLLSRDFFKSLRAPFACDYLIRSYEE